MATGRKSIGKTRAFKRGKVTLLEDGISFQGPFIDLAALLGVDVERLPKKLKVALGDRKRNVKKRAAKKRGHR